MTKRPSAILGTYRKGLLLFTALCSWLTPATAVFSQPPGPAMHQVPRLDVEQHISFRGDLAKVSRMLASTYRIPIVALLTQKSSSVELEGVFTGREALRRGLEANPDYDWEIREGVVYLFHRKVREDPNNMLRWRIKRFTISGTVADVELRLRTNLNKIRHDVKGEGGLLVGMLSTALSAHSLPTIVMENATGEEILLKVASLDRNFYSVLTYPKEPPIQREDLDSAFLNWKWIELPQDPHS